MVAGFLLVSFLSPVGALPPLLRSKLLGIVRGCRAWLLPEANIGKIGGEKTHPWKDLDVLVRTWIPGQRESRKDQLTSQRAG